MQCDCPWLVKTFDGYHRCMNCGKMYKVTLVEVKHDPFTNEIVEVSRV